MDKFKFYEVDKDYVAFLKTKDDKIPDISYTTNDKFICGVLFEINDMKYYAPVSSFNKAQKSNILIKSSKGRITSSIRFSFMFPVPDEMLQVKDFSKEKDHYKRLLLEELTYCNKNAEKIINKAKYIYRVVTEEKNELMQTNCCNFKSLEKACIEYCKDNGLVVPKIKSNFPEQTPQKETAVHLSPESQNSEQQHKPQSVRLADRLTATQKEAAERNAARSAPDKSSKNKTEEIA